VVVPPIDATCVSICAAASISAFNEPVTPVTKFAFSNCNDKISFLKVDISSCNAAISSELAVILAYAPLVNIKYSCESTSPNAGIS